MNESELRLDRQICFRLYRASRSIIRLYQPILDTLNITYPQYITMLVLWEDNVIDFKDLGRRLDLKTGTLTPIVKNLEQLGYVQREQNREDKRKIWVKITETGKELKSRAQSIPESLNHFINMDQEQYERYAFLLDELVDLLKNAETKQKEKELR
ncbi:MarR family transcriptional regulator [Oceanispirochaeta crateris]|uniref:HTH-type transcriptional regulator SarZ n=1 Tax=Oceanispirochaeta crateris TaxID=2518645 RepID=A0A5C1QM95_9SPIO|nr:MarR family transcriptional regulator [Oceanispirochaeta crateris]QEN08090.1 MarR family transcriptional regulator [Oceanispirochaeta crateris]